MQTKASSDGIAAVKERPASCQNAVATVFWWGNGRLSTHDMDANVSKSFADKERFNFNLSKLLDKSFSAAEVLESRGFETAEWMRKLVYSNS